MVAETCAINVEAALNWPVPVEAIINGCLLASESSVAVADTAGGVHTAEATCITVADKVGNVVESIESVSGYFE
ncbi:hypothetical protein [Nocardia arthritidis]|uniref:Uncharacterized protein n=1 Tax=Nocardia arthritidis TaxID=228602 RepID=A0A6G9YIH7_9NOCA|nr:hypothetical protein [Nocardia arthritidis]QIS13059.1 hypothetical protein F5544_26025 [Nocardia arthritidis]